MIKKKIKSLKFNSNQKYIVYFRKKRIITSLWIDQILSQKKYDKIKFSSKIIIQIISVKELGFSKSTYLKDIYRKALKNGLKLVDPSLSLVIRDNIKKQKKASWIRIAVPLKSMIDRDGIPHLPKLGYALKHNFVETFWAYPKAIFYPHNQFIFIDENI